MGIIYYKLKEASYVLLFKSYNNDGDGESQGRFYTDNFYMDTYDFTLYHDFIFFLVG